MNGGMIKALVLDREYLERVGRGGNGPVCAAPGEPEPVIEHICRVLSIDLFGHAGEWEMFLEGVREDRKRYRDGQ